MDNATRAGLVIGVLAVLVVLWFVWRFFFALFKHVVIALVLGAIGAGAYYYLRARPPARNPAIGKYAYLKENGKYLGVIEAEGDDNQRGKVWVVRPPGRYPVIYAKPRVAIKDRLEPGAPLEDPEASPTPTPSVRKGKRTARPKP